MALPGLPNKNPAGNPFYDETAMELARESPEMAIAAYRRARGQQGPDKGLYGKFREGRMGTAVQAFLQQIMPNSDGSFVGDPLGQANAGVAGMMTDLREGRGVGGALRAQAARLLPQDLSSYGADDIKKILAAQGAAAGYGYGVFGQMPINNMIEQLEHQAQQYELSPEFDPDVAILGKPGALQAFQALMQQYLATK